MACPASSLDVPLHSNLGILAQCRRRLLRQAHKPTPQARHVHLHHRPQGRHPPLHRRGQLTSQTLHVDRRSQTRARRCQTREASVRVSPLASAVRLCDAKFGNLFLYEYGGLRVAASHDLPPAFAEARRRSPLHPPPGTGLCEAIETKQTVHVADLAAAQPYAERHPAVVEAVELGGIRTFVAVPMLKDNELIGMIVIYRQAGC